MVVAVAVVVVSVVVIVVAVVVVVVEVGITWGEGGGVQYISRILHCISSVNFLSSSVAPGCGDQRPL